MPVSLWKQCLERLESEVPLRQFDTWLRPLQAEATSEGLRLLAPNQYVRDWVDTHYAEHIHRVAAQVRGEDPVRVTVGVGSLDGSSGQGGGDGLQDSLAAAAHQGRLERKLRPDFTFANFIEGRSNQLARAAALQVAEHPGVAYNPLLIYGGTGLGKTHLMHAIGNVVAQRRNARVAFRTAEEFFGDFVNAVRHDTHDQFKQIHRSIETLLIDDIQFWVRKKRTQEEFFHTFDALLQMNHQIVLTCDRYPKEVDGLPLRLTSRFEGGISFPIEPPELETRVAILKSKADLANVELPDDVALFIANRLKSNVRELEGALRRLIASSRFQHRSITLELCRETLRDIFAIQERMVSIDNIQRTVADYFNIRTADLGSKRRSRSVARPRQIAMALARELTNRSYPEIGAEFGNRDHTTVLHACRKVESLRLENESVERDYRNLLRLLST